MREKKHMLVTSAYDMGTCDNTHTKVYVTDTLEHAILMKELLKEVGFIGGFLSDVKENKATTEKLLENIKTLESLGVDFDDGNDDKYLWDFATISVYEVRPVN